jgi:hypothetical protein
MRLYSMRPLVQVEEKNADYVHPSRPSPKITAATAIHPRPRSFGDECKKVGCREVRARDSTRTPFTSNVR